MPKLQNQLPITSPYNEPALLKQVAEGNERAFAELISHYADNLFGVAFTYTKSSDAAKDIIQDVFVKIWSTRHKLPSIASFKDYLFITIRNHIFNYIRDHKRDKHFLSRALSLSEGTLMHSIPASKAANPEQELIFKESQALIEKAVDTLPPQQQLVYRLKRQRNMSLDEIAAELNISPNTAKNHLSRALLTIRELLKDHAEGSVLILALVFCSA